MTGAPDRVVVFMDYQNIHGWARRSFCDFGADVSDGHISPLKIGEMLTARRPRPSELKEVRVYRGRPNPERQPTSASANDRQASRWESSAKVTVIRRNLDYPHNWPDEQAREKGIDVAIAVDMIHLAMTGHMDVAILFSSDKDLLPAVEVIYNERLCHVEVAAWTQANRLRFPDTQMPWCHSLNDAAFEAVRDKTDYTLQPKGIPSNIRPKLPPH